MLVDEAQITVTGGHGGNGKASFYPGFTSGPSGGNGGKGGDIYAVLDKNLNSLSRYSTKRIYKGQNGTHGGGFLKIGRDGDSLELPIPASTTIIDLNTNEEVEINNENQRILLVKGGKGGRGNNEFKSSTNTAPDYAEEGRPGEEKKLKLILKLIADYGLIGLPNAGKSSLLNELTAAHVRTAAYAFTTLEPNLGVCNGTVIADIPGLIEGASKGKGLGIRFLKHIEKVKLLFHCISLESNDAEHDYVVIRKELEQFNPLLLHKPEIILLTKSDLVTPKQITAVKKMLTKYHREIYVVSIHDWDSLQSIIKLLA